MLALVWLLLLDRSSNPGSSAEMSAAGEEQHRAKYFADGEQTPARLCETTAAARHKPAGVYGVQEMQAASAVAGRTSRLKLTQ
jgi:hypothetical protein